MSFSSTVKEELSRQLTTARHCQIAEMAAILSLCGRVKISASDHFAIAIHTENLAVARKYFTLLKKTFNINTDVLIRQGLLPARSRTYVVAVREHEDALRVLQAAKLLDANGEIAEDLSLVHNVIVQNTCCRRAFIRGAFKTHLSKEVIYFFTWVIELHVITLPHKPSMLLTYPKDQLWGCASEQ